MSFWRPSTGAFFISGHLVGSYPIAPRTRYVQNLIDQILDSVQECWRILDNMDTVELSDVINFLKHTSCFNTVDESFVESAARHTLISYHRRGARLSENELSGFFWLVRSGAVETLTGNGTLLAHVGEGDFFGPRDLVSHHHSCDQAVMMEDTLLYKIDRKNYSSLCDQSAQFRRLCRDEFDHKMHTLVESRSDTLALTHKLRDFFNSSPVTCEHHISISEAAKIMSEHKVSSLPVMHGGKLAGIITDRDMRSRVVAESRNLNDPISSVMTENPITIDINSFTFEALMIMSKNNVHHLPIVEANKLVGIITVTDLIRQQRSQPVFVIGEIWKARTLDELISVAENLPDLFVRLVEADARPSEISRILTAIADAITQRLLTLFQKQAGKPPIPFVWLAFGSQGREDLSISSDQDNALLLADEYDESIHGNYFSTMADFICDGLAACGYEYCPGEIMASSEQWRQPLRTWKEQFRRWIEEPEEKAVMFSSIFFDIRVVSGDRGLFNELHQFILNLAAKNRIFLAHMAKNALTHRPPLGLFRGLVLENSGEHKNQLDVKHKGTIPVTDVARQHALARNIEAVNTLERLQALADNGFLNKRDVASLIDAHEFIADLRFKSQAREIRKGKKPDNFIPPATLSPLEKHHLKSAFKLIKANQESMASEFLGGFGR